MSLLHQCLEFPNCDCYRGLGTFNDILTEWRSHPDWPNNVTTEELQYLIFIDYMRLRCIAANAKSRLWRWRAEVLLLKPMYRKYWSSHP